MFGDTNIEAKPTVHNNFHDLEASSMWSTRQKSNSIHQSVKVKLYHYDMYPKYKQQVLDTELLLETKNNEVKIVPYNDVKVLTSKYLIHRNTVIADNVKFNILIANLRGVMRNVS